MERPIGAAVLTIIGGIFILIGGLLISIIGFLFLAFLGLSSSFFYIGLVIGVLTLVMGALMLVMPSAHVAWGALVIVLAIVSWVFALGGFFLGFLLALIGGILAILWKPAPTTPQPYTTTGYTVPPPPR